MARQKVLQASDLPTQFGAYMDNERHVWLYESDPPSETGLWRTPGRTLAKPTNAVLQMALERYGVTELRRMVPVRRRG